MKDLEAMKELDRKKKLLEGYHKKFAKGLRKVYKDKYSEIAGEMSKNVDFNDASLAAVLTSIDVLSMVDIASDIRDHGTALLYGGELSRIYMNTTAHGICGVLSMLFEKVDVASDDSQVEGLPGDQVAVAGWYKTLLTSLYAIIFEGGPLELERRFKAQGEKCPQDTTPMVTAVVANLAKALVSWNLEGFAHLSHSKEDYLALCGRFEDEISDIVRREKINFIQKME